MNIIFLILIKKQLTESAQYNSIMNYYSQQKKIIVIDNFDILSKTCINIINDMVKKKEIVNKLIVTFVDTSIEDGDVFYTDIDYKKWNLIEESFYNKDNENEYNFSIKVYKKSTNSE